MIHRLRDLLGNRRNLRFGGIPRLGVSLSMFLYGKRRDRRTGFGFDTQICTGARKLPFHGRAVLYQGST